MAAAQITFLSLVPEVRSVIYFHLFADAFVSVGNPFSVPPDHLACRVSIRPKPDALLTCRLVYMEALPIFAGAMEIKFGGGASAALLLPAIREKYLKHVPDIKVCTMTNLSPVSNFDLTPFLGLRRLEMQPELFAFTSSRLIDLFVDASNLEIPYLRGDYDLDHNREARSKYMVQTPEHWVAAAIRNQNKQYQIIDSYQVTLYKKGSPEYLKVCISQAEPELHPANAYLQSFKVTYDLYTLEVVQKAEMRYFLGYGV